MSYKIRTFVAIELNEVAHRAAEEMSRYIGLENFIGINLVKPENMHITLKFLGYIDPNNLNSIITKISSVAKTHKPFKLKLTEVGCSPNSASPRVLWISGTNHDEVILSIKRELEKELDSLGYPKDHRDFDPHMTIARIKHFASKTSIQKAICLLSTLPTNICMNVDVHSISLIQSALTKPHATYNTLARISLHQR